MDSQVPSVREPFEGLSLLSRYTRIDKITEYFFRMYFLFLAQTHTRYSTARKPIKFACRENKPLLFSRDDQSTVNRLHLPHLSLFLRAEKQQFRRSLNDNKGTIVHFTEL